MVNWTADQIAADLETSAAILGVKEVIAYPYGHYNDTAKQGVTQAGFEMARTIESGYVSIGTDKLALPVVRDQLRDGPRRDRCSHRLRRAAARQVAPAATPPE